MEMVGGSRGSITPGLFLPARVCVADCLRVVRCGPYSIDDVSIVIKAIQVVRGYQFELLIA